MTVYLEHELTQQRQAVGGTPALEQSSEELDAVMLGDCVVRRSPHRIAHLHQMRRVRAASGRCDSSSCSFLEPARQMSWPCTARTKLRKAGGARPRPRVWRCPSAASPTPGRRCPGAAQAPGAAAA